ncbi:MAG TPA: cytochrome c-type biogenesis protein [Microvirga sp.]|nr:cytochrome c-type biogenesis protein [Microvirga sp.]
MSGRGAQRFSAARGGAAAGPDLRIRSGAVLGAAVALCLALSGLARAVQPDEVLKDPALEQRARAISAGLRCLVCQNQSIDDSDAPLAKDLRVLVRERLQAGDTDQQVRDFVVQRYGEFVLLRPVFGPHTALLWLTPVLVLALGAAGILAAARRRRAAGPPPLDADESAAVERILKG